MGPSWISDLNDFSYFWSSSDPNTSYHVSSIGRLVQEKKFKINFQNWSHLGFPIGTILAIFDLQVTLTAPTKFPVNWPFGSGEVQNKVSRWWPSWISNFSYSWSTKSPCYFLSNFQSIGLSVQEKKFKIEIFKMGAILDFWLEWL